MGDKQLGLWQTATAWAASPGSRICGSSWQQTAPSLGLAQAKPRQGTPPVLPHRVPRCPTPPESAHFCCVLRKSQQKLAGLGIWTQVWMRPAQRAALQHRANVCTSSLLRLDTWLCRLRLRTVGRCSGSVASPNARLCPTDPAGGRDLAPANRREKLAPFALPWTPRLRSVSSHSYLLFYRHFFGSPKIYQWGSMLSVVYAKFRVSSCELSWVVPGSPVAICGFSNVADVADVHVAERLSPTRKDTVPFCFFMKRQNVDTVNTIGTAKDTHHERQRLSYLIP